MAVKRVHKGADGWEWTVWVPESSHPAMTAYGTRAGPPPMDALGLPEEVAKRLQSQLNQRGILTFADFKKRRTEVLAALQAAYKVDAQALEVVYRDWDGA